MGKIKNIERALIFIAITIIILTNIFDIIDDQSSGETILRSLLDDDVIASFALILILLYIWKVQPIAKQKENIHLKRLVKHSDNDLALWKSRASVLLKGLGEKINQQFDIWNLSNAEKDVALLLVKGMSFKDVASFRNTNEKTVRQQASGIYSKANLDNRAELSAFFLEDLLLPDHTFAKTNLPK